MLNKLKQLGPGVMVAAAFIGPGTVTTATIAGAGYGYTLLWAILFSIVATIILQEMSARLGVIGGMGVGEALRDKPKIPIIKVGVIVLVIGAILVGNAAYEAGNITGAVLGFEDFGNNYTINPLIILIGVVAFGLLYSGQYKIIERSLIALVSIMGIVFLVSAIMLQPDLGQIASNLFIPKLPKDASLMVVGLIGTTVVPYNLFLHASSSKEKWSGQDGLNLSRWDTVISITLGGIITMAILITAAVAFENSGKTVNSFGDLSSQLGPLLGNWSTNFIAFGFLAAGLSSSVTAPLAAAYATSEVLGWKHNLKGKRFRFVWAFVLILGIIFSSLGFKPTAVILFAQVANGLLLPIIAGFLVWIMNDKRIMGQYSNSTTVNVLGVIVILITLGLGVKSILSALGKL
ncbi:divalent metal cation transporter [Fulvivirga sp. RKSG066]|uniref:Nramp family divalent metal transporter n=1 Tax=Fulvivirga aurantia TaxID=2529383 RepID=UPI0012BC1B62|nr:Nramp family divalent metal transporter [Fulvivirga aurantia]MTI20359.1 divalent metal cation transporter [Fulvivirga aurantia]